MSIKSKFKSVVSKVKSGVKSYVKNVVGGAKIVGKTLSKIKVPKKSQTALVFSPQTPQQAANLKKSANIPAGGNINLSGAQIGQSQIDARNKASFNPILGGGNIENAEVGFGAVADGSDDSTLGQFGVTPYPTRTSRNKGIVLPKAPAPTSADEINTDIGTINLSGTTLNNGTTTGTTGTMGTPGASTAEAQAATAGLDAATNQKIELEKQQLAIDAKQEKQQTFLDKLIDVETPAEVGKETRENLEEQYGIKSQVATINSLQESLSKVETEAANQVAQTRDVLGSMNFINNQIAQIERNSAPAINRLRADINFKTGILTQNRQLMEQAVQDATAQTRDEWNRSVQIYNLNQDIIDSMDAKYQNAYKEYMNQKELAHKDDLALHDWKVEQIIKYGLSNSINDSEQTIMESIRRKGFQTVSDRNKEEDTITDSPLSLIQKAIDAGLSLDEAVLDIAGEYESQGIQVDQKTISAWKKQAKNLKPTPVSTPQTPSTPFSAKGLGQSISDINYRAVTRLGNLIIQTPKTVGSFFSGLFGG
mgnify:CR=1 FL=1